VDRFLAVVSLALGAVPAALARGARSLSRTWRFVRVPQLRAAELQPFPPPPLTFSLLAQVAMEHALMAVAMSPSRFPAASDLDRVADEVYAARTLFGAEGWLDDPGSYHRTPPALEEDDLTWHRGRALGIAYEQMSFESRFAPRSGEPGARRWESYAANHVAAATIVRHRGAERPWLVCVHGFSMGYPVMDFAGLQTARLHREHGLNVALPVLPLHGPRKVTPLSGEPFLSFEMMNSVHGLAQSVWDVRRLVGWLRSQGATSIGLYGVSLGAYVVALLAGLDPGFEAVVAGIPVVDLPTLFAAHSPVPIRRLADRHGILGTGPEVAHHVVSPLAFNTTIAHDRRFIFAGYGDRMAFPSQAVSLWEHWSRPAICWYPGSHVGYLWSRPVARFLDRSLTTAGLTERAWAE
jgi:hypothetical protein